jgi:hypothetical protein
MPAPGIHGWREHESPPHFFKDISEKDLVTRAGRLGGCRYNRFSLQVESVYSDYLRVAILGKDIMSCCVFHHTGCGPLLCMRDYLIFNHSFLLDGHVGDECKVLDCDFSDRERRGIVGSTYVRTYVGVL